MTERKKNIIAGMLCVLLLCASCTLRTPRAYENFKNADATYHVLLTIHAYEQTSPAVHHFIPLSTLGAPEDKHIPWGGTIPDEQGNYYYLSFSNAGFVVPYLFIKLLHLPVTRESLYLFNCVLYIACALLTGLLFARLFRDKLPVRMVFCTAVALYAFSFEIMSAQGITYWVHSLYQLIFLAQALAFFAWERKGMRVCFLMLCVLGAYTEWTGFVANAGFALALCVQGGVIRKEKRLRITRECALGAAGIAGATLLAGALYIAGFLSVLPWENFFSRLAGSFAGRSFMWQDISYLSLVMGYACSFGALLVLCGVALPAALCCKAARTRFTATLWDMRGTAAVFLIPLLENLLLKEHAISYTFDRMKGAFLLIFLLLLSLYALTAVSRRILVGGVCAAGAAMCISFGLYCFTQNSYRWSAPFLQENEEMAARISAVYDRSNSIIGQDTIAVRGYTTLLLDRNVYEWISAEQLADIAAQKNKRYVVLLHGTEQTGNLYLYHYTGFTVYDLQTGQQAEYTNT